MFIEKYQPYTSLLITYNGEEIGENNPIILPTTINGEYKVNLDAIGVDDDGEREDLPFTRNDITWWLLDDVNGILTKEINVGDNAGSKFTIEDSGTLSIISTAFSAPENTSLEVVCILGKPNTLNIDEFDFDAIPNANTILPFASGGGGESDLNIAEVTIINTTGTTFTMNSAQFCYDEGELGEGSPAMLYAMAEVDGNSQKTFRMPLYKGGNFCNFGNVLETTGSITNMGSGGYLVSGDCSVSVSPTPIG